MSVRWIALGLVVCLLASVPTGQAQQPSLATAVIDGTVVDVNGGVIPGATVALAQDGKSISTSVTNTAGTFRFANLVDGAYRVTTSLTGFKTAISDVTIASQKSVPLRVVLEIGALTEAVAVSTATTLVQTQATVTSSTISGLPRQSMNSLTFLPGVAVDAIQGVAVTDQFHVRPRPGSGELYAPIVANPFRLTSQHPLSTFAADVDTASYTNVRRFLTRGELPPPDAVRIEELVNYFRFAYPEPRGGDPVSITTEIGECPWSPGHKLALIGLRARPIDDREAPGRNLTLLLDVSGSMAPPERLPLIKTALRMFVDTLRPDDRLAIVVYASATGLVLPATPGSHRARIHDAIEGLEAGGSTNGGAGLQLAYQVARQNFIRGGVNRVILATDGDFNVGLTTREDLLALIERERQSGVFLSVLGVGSGNLKDATMELLADKGNGHYAYLDSIMEARRVLVREGGATLETVAKDVKLQIEFNPAHVAAYRLIGYENRLLAARDFNDDAKDGGEMGAGHTVTVLYEIVPSDVELPDGVVPATSPEASNGRPAIDPLRYQERRPTTASGSGELLTIKVRYKAPDADTSRLLQRSARAGGTALHLPFAAAVAEFGLLLRDPQAAAERWASLTTRAGAVAAGGVSAAERETFAELVATAGALQKQRR
jgi:Ca-activated chloride channel family protein